MPRKTPSKPSILDAAKRKEVDTPIDEHSSGAELGTVETLLSGSDTAGDTNTETFRIEVKKFTFRLF